MYGTNKNDSHLKIERWLNTLEFWEELQKLLDDTAEMYKKLNRAVPMYGLAFQSTGARVYGMMRWIGLE